MSTTQPERNALARELGMGPEVCPWLWACERCHTRENRDDCMHCMECGDEPDAIQIPCPLSDDPAACLWDGAFMRALDKPGLDPQLILGGGEAYVGTGVQSSEKHYFAKTPTAALYAAWKETQCQPNP
jgi:hypothetical protein